MIEPRTGVFLGNPSRRVRDELWELALAKVKPDSAVTQVWSHPCPQGYLWRQHGSPSKALTEWEGLTLVTLPPRERRRPGDPPPPDDPASDLA